MEKKEISKEKIKDAKSWLKFDIAIAEHDGYEMSEEEKMLRFAWYAEQIDDVEYTIRLNKLLYGTDLVLVHDPRKEAEETGE